jgi:hypothetical protein
MEMIRVRASSRLAFETRPLHCQLSAFASRYTRRSEAVLIFNRSLEGEELIVVIAAELVRAELKKARRRSIPANRDAIEVDLELRAAQPIARRASAQAIDLDTRPNTPRPWVDETTKSADHVGVFRQRAGGVDGAGRRFDAERTVAIRLRDTKHQ